MDKYEKLKELKTLLDKGLLDENEFTKLKNEILFSDDVIPKNDSGHNTFSNTKSFENEQNDSKKPNFEKNIFDEIAYKNSQTSSKNRTPNVKTKNNNNLILFVLIVGMLLFFFNIDKNNNSNQSTQESTQDSSTTSSSNNSIENNSTICIICGRSFIGDGYDKIDGVWKQNTNMQTELCSSNCAMVEDQRQNQKYNDILVKHGYAPIDFDSQSSTSNHAQPNKNGFFTGSDGQLHQASPCGNCHHTGFIDNGDGMQVCPMCDGKGEKIY